MSELRIALILIGVIILAGIYVYHQWRSSQAVEEIFSEESETEDVLLGDQQDSEVEFLVEDRAMEPALSSSFLNADDTVEEQVEQDDPRLFDLQSTQEVSPVHQYEAVDGPPDLDADLVVMHLVATDGKPFRGQAVLKAMQAHKMRFGEFNIYHRIMEDEGQPESIFSIANMVKPGTLSPVELPQSQLKGLTFFLRLPTMLDSRIAFDDMLHVAQQMAAVLDGTLNDQNFGPLTDERVSTIRSGLD